MEESWTGWQFVQASQKRHYFADGLSLCGRFFAINPHPNPPTPEIAAYYNCLPCERKLKTGSIRKRYIRKTRGVQICYEYRAKDQHRQRTNRGDKRRETSHFVDGRQRRRRQYDRKK